MKHKLSHKTADLSSFKEWKLIKGPVICTVCNNKLKKKYLEVSNNINKDFAYTINVCSNKCLKTVHEIAEFLDNSYWIKENTKN